MTDLHDPKLYFNRELSLLEFQARVLAQAKDPNVPLLERLRFLTICSTNLDEFYEIRVAGVEQQIAYGVRSTTPDAIPPKVLLERISKKSHEIIEEQYKVLNDDLLPALRGEGVYLLRRGEWSSDIKKWIGEYFETQVLPVLTPVGLDPSHPFPQILNKSLNFAITIEGKDAYGRSGGHAVLQVPRSLPRIIALPTELSKKNDQNFVLLSSVIHANVEQVFPGMNVNGCYQFRVTRNSDLFVDEEAIDDLLHALRGELPSRKYGDAVRLEVTSGCPDETCDFLLERFELDEESLFRVNGPVNLYRLAELCTLVQKPHLLYSPYPQKLPKSFDPDGSIFEWIRRKDVLLHHPFDSFSPVLALVRQSAKDSRVLAIKQTLYRTDPGSPIVDALIAAAKAGKEVTAVVELRARFDEAANIELATRLQDAGANVVYGVVGYKTHSKMLMIVRRESGGRIRRYVHLGTGNYHTKTARLYTDFGLLTCKKAVGEDVHKLFMQLTGLGKVSKLSKLVQAPFTLSRTLLKRIEAETKEAAAGREARIIAKMNSLNDEAIIRALYEASQAGVQIDLIVRGLCCLRPGVKGVSENIHVRSIVGRYLEHTRVYYFHAGGKSILYLSSADWMERNLHRRVETCFPVDDLDLRERVRQEGLEMYLRDERNAWLLKKDGSYEKIKGGKKSIAAQEELMH